MFARNSDGVCKWGKRNHGKSRYQRIENCAKPSVLTSLLVEKYQTNLLRANQISEASSLKELSNLFGGCQSLTRNFNLAYAPKSNSTSHEVAGGTNTKTALLQEM